MLALVVPIGLACSFGEIYNGCGSHGTEDVSTADLVGTWSGAEAGRLTLSADSSFVAVDLREPDGAGTTLVSGHGTWTLNQTSSKDTKRRPDTSDIGLVFVKPDGTNRAWNRIDVDLRRPVSRLQYLVGEASSCDLRALDKEPP